MESGESGESSAPLRAEMGKPWGCSAFGRTWFSVTERTEAQADEEREEKEWTKTHIPGLRDLRPRGTIEWLILIHYFSHIALFVARNYERFVPRNTFECVNDVLVQVNLQNEYLSYQDISFYVPALIQMTINVVVFFVAVWKVHNTRSKVKAIDAKQLVLTLIPVMVLIIAWFIVSSKSSWYLVQIAIDVGGYGFMILVWGLRWEREQDSADLESPERASRDRFWSVGAVRQHRKIFRRFAAVLHFILFLLVINANLIYESSATLYTAGPKYFASLIEDIVVFELLTVVIYYIYQDYTDEQRQSAVESSGFVLVDSVIESGPNAADGAQEIERTKVGPRAGDSSPPWSWKQLQRAFGCLGRGKYDRKVDPLNAQGAVPARFVEPTTTPKLNGYEFKYIRLNKKDWSINLTYGILLFFYITDLASFRMRFAIQGEFEPEIGGPVPLNTTLSCEHNKLDQGSVPLYEDHDFLGLSVSQLIINMACLAVVMFAFVRLKRIAKAQQSSAQVTHDQVFGGIHFHPQWMPLSVALLCLFGVQILWIIHAIQHNAHYVIQLGIEFSSYSLIFIFWGLFPTCKQDKNGAFWSSWILSGLAFVHIVYFLTVLICHFVHETTTTYQEVGLPYLIAMLENIALFEVLHMIIHRLDDAWNEYRELCRVQ
jgi:hypothetical protein